jgi:hypothetical protein
MGEGLKLCGVETQGCILAARTKVGKFDVGFAIERLFGCYGLFL